MFYRGALESILTSSLTLQRVVRTAERIIRTSPPPVQDLYPSRCRSRATEIVNDPTHPCYGLFRLLSSGKRYCSAGLPDSAEASFHMPESRDCSTLFDMQTYQDCCTLENRGQLLSITAHTGGSVLLPCYCTDLQTKPENIWKIINRNRNKYEVISRESGQYRNRVQLVNDHSPGNLSLLISHLTEEDEGVYQCGVKDSFIIIRLTVKEPPPSLPFIPFGLVTVILLHIIVAVVYYTSRTKGCTLENRGQLLHITAHTGGSVLLPCSCTDLQTTPEEFSWKKENTNTQIYEEISRESGQYRNRVRLVNDHSPGNLSLLISHLTEEDGGEY
ncbi:hypothetical protein NFI96_006309 [Prochilodus magdalenae]|nr:hypothetical protein NFI96_006309 [Prochilodus magdalenae]